jgi:hypothetical protein
VSDCPIKCQMDGGSDTNNSPKSHPLNVWFDVDHHGATIGGTQKVIRCMPRQTVSSAGKLEPERPCSDPYGVRVKVEWDERVTLHTTAQTSRDGLPLKVTTCQRSYAHRGARTCRIRTTDSNLPLLRHTRRCGSAQPQQPAGKHRNDPVLRCLKSRATKPHTCCRARIQLIHS